MVLRVFASFVRFFWGLWIMPHNVLSLGMVFCKKIVIEYFLLDPKHFSHMLVRQETVVHWLMTHMCCSGLHLILELPLPFSVLPTPVKAYIQVHSEAGMMCPAAHLYNLVTKGQCTVVAHECTMLPWCPPSTAVGSACAFGMTWPVFPGYWKYSIKISWSPY